MRIRTQISSRVNSKLTMLVVMVTYSLRTTQPRSLTVEKYVSTYTLPVVKIGTAILPVCEPEGVP